jgi:hypothetical protein
MGRVLGSPKSAEWEQAARKMSPPLPISLAEAGLAAWFGQFSQLPHAAGTGDSAIREQNLAENARMMETTRSLTLAAFLGSDELAPLRALAAKETEPPLLAQQVSVLAMFGEDKPARAALPRLTAAAQENGRSSRRCAWRTRTCWPPIGNLTRPWRRSARRSA